MMLDMKIHRLRLAVIRNRVFIFWGAALCIYVFSFVLGFLLLGRLQQVVNTIEDNQKGTLCIISIQPKDRTRENITNCVNNNRRNGSNKVEFKDSSGSDITSPSSQSIRKPVNLTKKEPITVTEEPSQEPPVIEPTPTIPIIPLPQIERRLNQVHGVIECRVVGTINWQMGEGCNE